MDDVPPGPAGAPRARSAQGESRRRSEPYTHRPLSLDRRTSLHHEQRTLAESRTSLQSIASLNTDSAEETLVKCKYSNCTSRATPSEAKRYYKSCHNCSYIYCSKECRRAHWEKHRKVCLHSRASSLCRLILSTAKEDTDTLHQVSTLAHRGYLAVGRGVVRVLFTSSDAAEKFTTFGYQYLSQPEYVRWSDLRPHEMGVELFAEVVKLCRSYDPESRLILFVAVCVISEVPTEGAVRWERQLVSRCGKLRLSRAVSAAIRRTGARHAAERRAENGRETDTLILRWRTDKTRRQREHVQVNINRELEKRGVVLKKHFPEVHAKLTSYVEGTADRFVPVTIHPRDVNTGNVFACVITPAADGGPERTDSSDVVVVDAGGDADHQISTPM